MNKIHFPYGHANFYTLITDGDYYVDRTSYIRTLEEKGRTLLFLRPRRFGKSLLLSMLENYYDVAKAAKFERLFGHLAIGQNPTPLHNQYLILYWDFSVVDPQGTSDDIQRSLYNHLNGSAEQFKVRYRDLLQHNIMLDLTDGLRTFHSLLAAVSATPYPLYLLIDEYDNFANEVLMTAQSGSEQRYQDLVEGEGIIKTVFKMVKYALGGRGLERVFMTGVSPVLSNDLTSGFNIVKNITLDDTLHAMCGFTEAEVATMLDQVAAWLPERVPITCYGFVQDVDTINPGQTEPQRCSHSNEVMVMCPKPHISTRRIDWVSPTHDCLKNPQVCHIMGLEGNHGALAPFVKRIQTEEDMQKTIERLRSMLRDKVAPDDDSDQAEAARSQFIDAVGKLTESYMEYMKPNTLHIEEMLALIFGSYWQQTREQPHGLPKEVRHMLISGEYVRGLFMSNDSILDWAACAVQYVRALEHELRRRVYEPCKSVLENKGFTFGTPGYILKKRFDEQEKNRHIFLSYVVQPNNATESDFVHLLEDIESLRDLRNSVAHTQSVNKLKAIQIYNTVLRATKDGREGSVLPRLVAMLKPPEQKRRKRNRAAKRQNDRAIEQESD